MEKPTVLAYVEQLTEREKKALEVAKRCLETAFDMEKTVGYQEWRGGRDPLTPEGGVPSHPTVLPGTKHP